ncbi:MAG: hypothetical protein ACYC61_24075 [Isosphaeraceae bacterium]
MRSRTRSSRIALLVIASTFLTPGARGDEHYYMILFGSQSEPKRLRDTHTWATFIRAIGEGPDPSRYAIEYHTISWLPRALPLRTWALCPEPGVNLDLYQTLDAVSARGERVTAWGPFLLDAIRDRPVRSWRPAWGPRVGSIASGASIYQRSLQVKQRLESGEVRYRAIDAQWTPSVSDCIHAVADVDPGFGRGHYPLIRVGEPATRFMARQVMLRSVVDQSQYDNSWLLVRLGLDRYPIRIVPPWRIPRRACVLCCCPE